MLSYILSILTHLSLRRRMILMLCLESRSFSARKIFGTMFEFSYNLIMNLFIYLHLRFCYP